MFKIFSKLKSKLFRWDFQPNINQSPIVILGNQKAGTSAIAHLLAEYGGLTKTVDIPESWWPLLGNLLSGQLRLVDFANRYKHRFASDLIKEPNFTFFYDQLKEIHPQGSFVFVIRDPRDNIRSLLNRMSLPGDREFIKLSNYKIDDTWLPIFDADLWGFEAGQYIEILSERWNRAADVYLDNKEKMILIRYEDFVGDKVGCIGRIAHALKISQKQDIAEKVDIQYQPAGNRNVSKLVFFGEENLNRITDACAERMALFGYETTLV